MTVETFIARTVAQAPEIETVAQFVREVNYILRANGLARVRGNEIGDLVAIWNDVRAEMAQAAAHELYWMTS